MKKVILSADGDSTIYLVPDIVADNLVEYKFPNEKSETVKNLGWTGLGEELPEEFRELPYFNF